MKLKNVMFLIGFALCIPCARAQALTVAEHAEDTVTGAFDTTGLIILGTGVAATAIAFNQDQAMHDTWVNHQRINTDASSVGNFWGTGVVEGTIALGQLIFDTDRGIADTEGLLASTIVTFGLKYGVARPRPDSNTLTSFPSGHTQISFASATSLTKSYGWGVGAPMIAMGVFTGLTRLSDDAHWFSDIVAGAAIGVLFGRASFKHHVHITPMVFDQKQGGMGVLAEWHF